MVMKCSVTYTFIITVLCLVCTVNCGTSRKELLKTDKEAVELRQIQTRAFDTVDKETCLRTIIATLQDLGFVIDKADNDIGTVSATKLDGYALKMTVSVRPRGETQLLVRANAQYGLKSVVDPEPYQNFFVSLGKAMFLEAHQVE